MSENKTKPTEVKVEDFIEAVEHERQRKEAYILLDLFKKVTGKDPVMWGPSIIGFGSYHYKYKTGREGDMIRTGFSPRKGSFTLYVMPGFVNYGELLSQLGKHKTGKSCLYINKLSDVDMNVLEELIKASLKYMDEKFPE